MFGCLQHEYMGYMEKKTTKRKTTIITLSDHNKEEIRNIDFQKQNMEEEFNQKKQGVYQTSCFIFPKFSFTFTNSKNTCTIILIQCSVKRTFFL